MRNTSTVSGGSTGTTSTTATSLSGEGANDHSIEMTNVNANLSASEAWTFTATEINNSENIDLLTTTTIFVGVETFVGLVLLGFFVGAM